jgi:uncharacterized membrane protein
MDIPKVRNYVGLNIISVVVALTLNFLAVSLPLNNKTTGELSDAYPNYFVPAGFTFSIWGIIYLLLIAFMIYQSYQYFKKDRDTMANIIAIGPWFLISGLANAGWIIAWHYEIIVLSLMIMLVLLYSLLRIYTSLSEGRPHTTGDNFLIVLPFSVYLGWISVATIANVTTLLVSTAWQGGSISLHYWAIIMIIIAAILGILMVFSKQDIAFAVVIIWALYGILSKQVMIEGIDHQSVATAAKYALTMLSIYCILSLIGKKSYFFKVKNK